MRSGRKWQLWFVPCILLNGGCPMLGGSGLGDDDVTAQSVVVAPGISTRTREGTTTGTTEDDVCDGFYPAQPNHTLVIDASLALKISVTSAAGTAQLFISCGQSTFCGSEVGDSTEFSRFWTTGNCDIYIGTTEQGATLEYIAQFTEGT